jgi:hypothetical protein
LKVIPRRFSNDIDKRFYYYKNSNAPSPWNEEHVQVPVEDYKTTSSRPITGATLNGPFSELPEIMVSDLDDESEPEPEPEVKEKSIAPLASPLSWLPNTPTPAPSPTTSQHDGDLVAMRVTTAMEELISMIEEMSKYFEGHCSGPDPLGKSSVGKTYTVGY